MRDTVSIARVDALHPKVKELVRACIDEAEKKFPESIAIRVVQGYRTFAEQQAIYNQGRTTPGPIVTRSKPGQSFHNFGLAIDFALMYDLDGNGTREKLSWDVLADKDHDGEADWMEVVDTFEAHGFTWGGHFSKIQDDPHFEMHFGQTWQSLLALHTTKQLLPGTDFVKLA
jgi:peptidoglycan L-alanyl-D-glutamate endopeptidase CwlK